MSLVLDAGALIALERNSREMWIRLRRAEHGGAPILTHAAVVGQVWRGGSRQTRLAHALSSVDVRAVDDALGRSAGTLLNKTGQTDVIDAALVLLANDGDEIATSDIPDLRPLAQAAGRRVNLIAP